MKAFHIIFNLISWIAIGIIAVMALYIISSNYSIFFGYRSFLVQSGSMEPAIMTGDIIIVSEQRSYILNDVITFKDAEGRAVTHRIAEIGRKNNGNEFSTKGDANRSQDFDTITGGQIIGKVVFIVPKLGYLMAFSKSLPGIIILIFIPAFLFIADELFKIKNA